MMEQFDKENDLDMFEPHINVREKEGWLRHAIILTYYFLMKYQAAIDAGDETIKERIYKDALYKIVREAGDTDTNACIVCGVLGALVGLKNIP